MKKKCIVLGICMAFLTGTVFGIDFTKINPTLGPSSYATSVYAGAISDNIGVNLEWGIGELPLTLGMGLSPLVIGEYALRAGYHPDIGIKNLDLYANFTLGFTSVLFIPGVHVNGNRTAIGAHWGGRYFFGPRFGAFAEAGYSIHLNYFKIGVSFKRKK